ncbi:MAG: MlaD family protein, partial [Actinomycetota bacterium]
MANPPRNPQGYDERIYRKGHPPHRMRNALILIALLLAGTYLAITKSVPFTPEYELKAVFENAANIRKDSPVRIAGVNVGEVVSTRSVGDVTEVSFTVDDSGRPIREDAQVEIRPRIFLEGNFFLDVKPGSPSAPELPDDGTVPITQTSTAVQLDQILTSLQAPDRENLQKL